MALCCCMIVSDYRSLGVNYGVALLVLSLCTVLLEKMNFVQWKQPLPRQAKHCKFQWGEESTLGYLFATITLEEIPAELILNWHQRDIKMVPNSTWTIEKLGVKRAERTEVNDRHLITAGFCGSLVWEFLPLQVVNKGKNSRFHSRFLFSRFHSQFLLLEAFMCCLSYFVQYRENNTTHLMGCIGTL